MSTPHFCFGPIGLQGTSQCYGHTDVLFSRDTVRRLITTLQKLGNPHGSRSG
jgi:hypothetical protein